MQHRLPATLFCFLFALTLAGEPLVLDSPDGNLSLRADASGEQLSITVLHKGKVVIAPSAIGLAIVDLGELGAQPRLTTVERTSADNWIEPVVARKRARVRDHYNAMRLEFVPGVTAIAGGYAVEFRAYDDGVAYRFVTTLQGAIEVADERMDLVFPDGSTVFFPEEEQMISHNEQNYLVLPLAELDATRLASQPVMVTVPDAARILISESDLFDYPAMWMRGAAGTALAADFTRFLLEVVPNPRRPDRSQLFERQAPYIARTTGARSFPWRAFIISDRDGAFIESELVYLLARPTPLADTSWIRPGRVAWDWYNALNIYGVDFKSGINNATYRYYIDFAAEYGIENIILDEGWSASTTDIMACNPEIDVPALVAYGAERGVGIILWALWGPVDRDMDAIFALYQGWGVKGVKIDFMQRSDQEMVNFYARAAAAAAKYQLLVDYHGAYKPTGLSRTYPNVLTYEGVKGNEWNKWSRDITPTHNLTIPFIRMAAGAMDYTPGSMSNTQPKNFNISFQRPMSMGTRCHEVAKYVVFESPLQMLCDTPSRYRREAETTAFIVRIPSVWDDTRVLDAAVGDYVVIARRSGAVWYLAAMTNENPRAFTLDLSFLPAGTYAAEIMRDGINADRHAEDYVRDQKLLDSRQPLAVELAPAGGWAAILAPVTAVNE
jgi:alpha-glucosidase